MLAYQHAYHAGNFADVHKHLAMFAVLRHLLRKPSPVTYVDTHAGRGLYPLDAEETQRLKEYRHGVASLWASRERLADDPLLGPWCEQLGAVQAAPRLSHYPGSPWWLSQACRVQDRLDLYELHPSEASHLDAQALPDQARRFHADGLAGLRASLPPATPRLCVLIDPSYEIKQEYVDVATTLQAVSAKVRHAIVLIWYPLLPSGRHHDLLDAVRRSGVRKVWRSELLLHPPGDAVHGMYGSGMLIFNPPWGVDTQLDDGLARVVRCLGDEASHASQWWVPE
ncbi:MULTISPECIES: 23S rRNA (adenine(2030)-N(6))-methyltransferase RlmJ [Chromohalobacter]|uniref:Ribosomal RNA large subunit methyltransferase J n=1 Tax=Chromohalobacter moromii TaxID=2860329 RepID=A0A9X3B5W8_9GAMM|nr:MULTISPECIES: 23S rRNA (adenine(2030)-N(6))-methyltransferase RlmJ [Chromohalobacter]MCK2045973.1 23S rRNA (adenine(2030)-N(6))-methyltransferase RlmJ [Chromohalobacter moromii]MCT8500181.1 23S rRNA (adenine(2030)-N(6))-methyltransferase RlmJ [Chromohalobacter canadensis]MCT8505603.1 23S rRNA (adenine(2030)-N(6))-methyltransferase RlmJ [Chromohalobacter moromii]